MVMVFAKKSVQTATLIQELQVKIVLNVLKTLIVLLVDLTI